MIERLKKFLDRENGAITVDWVVLTALIITLVTVLTGYMGDATAVMHNKASNYMSTKAIE